MLIELKVAKKRKKERKINSDDRTIWNDLCKSTIYPNMFPDSTCICFSHLQHRKSRIQRKRFFQSCLQDLHEACYVLLSGDESCPVRAKTHHSDFQSLVCSHPSHGRTQQSRPVSFGTLSTPHRLFFGHNKRRRHLCYGGWLYRHRCSVYQLCRVRHNSCKLLRMKLLIVLFFTRKAINFSFSHENHRLLRRSLLILYPWKKSYPHRGTREGESGWNASREYLIFSSILKRFYL